MEDHNIDKREIGILYYNEGHYKKAAQILKKVIPASIEYADICYRDLDKPHTCRESAEAYIKAMNDGDGDALSFVNSVIHLNTNTYATEEDMIQSLTTYFEQYKK